MPKLEIDKIPVLIKQVREHSDVLAEKGANKEDLHAHIERLESEMKKPQPDHGVISDSLAALETTIGEAEETLEKNGVLRFLNVVFGTGVPNP